MCAGESQGKALVRLRHNRFQSVFHGVEMGSRCIRVKPPWHNAARLHGFAAPTMATGLSRQAGSHGK
jgi:hypothetical protein